VTAFSTFYEIIKYCFLLIKYVFYLILLFRRIMVKWIIEIILDIYGKKGKIIVTFSQYITLFSLETHP